MKCIFTLTVTLTASLCNTITYKPSDIKLPRYPSDHIVENYMQKGLKNLLNGLDIYASPPESWLTTLYAGITSTPLPLFALESYEECKRIVRVNLNNCICNTKTVSPDDLQNVVDWWIPGNDFKLMHTLKSRPYMDIYPEVPKCLQYCMQWASAAQHKCKETRRASHTKRKVNKHEKNDVLTVYEIHPKLIDKGEKSQPYTNISDIDVSSQDSPNFSDSDKIEAVKVLCVYIAGHLLDRCINEIPDTKGLEQLKSDMDNE